MSKYADKVLKQDEIEVASHKRSKPAKPKKAAEPISVARGELQVVAPKTGEKIVTVPPRGPVSRPPGAPSGGGVRIMGGGQGGR